MKFPDLNDWKESCSFEQLFIFLKSESYSGVNFKKEKAYVPLKDFLELIYENLKPKKKFLI